MNLDDQLTRTLQHRLDLLDPRPGDLTTIAAAGHRLRRRRRQGVAAGALALVVAAGAGAVTLAPATTPSRDDTAPADPAPAPAPSRPELHGWRQLPAPPLAPRTEPMTGWTGTEALVVGGDGARPNGTLGGDPLTDGAAYDPVTDTWRPLPDAPLPISGQSDAATVGDQLVVVTGAGWIAYDADDDAWRTLPDPPTPRSTVGDAPISGGDDRVYAVAEDGTVLVLDPAADTWTVLEPPRPEGVLTAVAVPGGVAVNVEVPTSQMLEVDVWDGTAWSRHVTGQTEPMDSWTGEHLAHLSFNTYDVDGQTAPGGGRLDLDTGEWTPIPSLPQQEVPPITADAAGSGRLLTEGYVYDDRAGSGVRLTPPAGVGTVMPGALLDDEWLYLVGGQRAGRPPAVTADAWVWAP